MVTEGLYAASAALLLLAGAQKVADPQPLVRALISMHIALGPSWVRAGALGEFLLGAAAMVNGSRVVTGLVAASYAGFTVVVVLALRRGGVLASCGCFGKRDIPATGTHAAVTAGFALVALGASIQAPQVIWSDAALVAATLALAGCAYAVLAVLPLVRTR